MDVKPGDIVRYRGRVDPETWIRSVIPPAKRPLGLVLSTRTYRTSNDEYGAFVECVNVQWFDPTWNTTGPGYSEEMAADLELVQKL